mgnify:CR=1 FL=1
MSKKRKLNLVHLGMKELNLRKDPEDIRKTFQNQKKEIINPITVKVDNGK